MSNDENQKTNYRFLVAIIGLVFLLPVFILEKLNQQPIRSRNARITKWLMFGVIASNALHHIVWMLELSVCVQCKIQYSSWGVTKAILKGFNLIFLIHRAKLVQGITPVLSNKWFEKIFPRFIVVMICGFIFASIDDGMHKNAECAPYDNWDGILHCQGVQDPDPEPDAEAEADGGDNGFVILIASAIGLDSLITAFLMVLFIIPLYRVYKVDLGVMNRNQLSHRKKLKHLLIWSIGLTAINQMTSTLIMASFLPGSNFPFFLVLIGESDPVINVWTAWLMVTRNRQYLKRLCCCRRIRGASISRSGSIVSGLTNQLSRTITNDIKRAPPSIEMIQIDRVVSITDHERQNPKVDSKS